MKLTLLTRDHKMANNAPTRRPYQTPTVTDEIPLLSQQCRMQLNQACEVGTLIRQANADGRKMDVYVVNQNARTLVQQISTFQQRLEQIDASVRHLVGKSVGVSNIGSVLQAGELYQKWIEDWTEHGLATVSIILNELQKG